MSQSQPEQTTFEAAVDAGVEAASEFVSSLPLGERKWDSRELSIAEIAAREALTAFRLYEARKHAGQNRV